MAPSYNLVALRGQRSMKNDSCELKKSIFLKCSNSCLDIALYSKVWYVMMSMSFSLFSVFNMFSNSQASPKGGTGKQGSKAKCPKWGVGADITRCNNWMIKCRMSEKRGLSGHSKMWEWSKVKWPKIGVWVGILKCDNWMVKSKMSEKRGLSGHFKMS